MQGVSDGSRVDGGLHFRRSIKNQEQTRWLSWNVDESLRGHDFARNSGFSSDTEYGAGEFPPPTRPPAGAATQSTFKRPSKFRSQQTEGSYPDCGGMRRELERAQRERDKAIQDRD